MNDVLTAQTVELLQQLIRNRCVNDGSVASGQEIRTSDVLRAYLEGSGLDIEVYEPDGAPGRTSLVARIEGSDPAAPTLCLMGHTDVVPVTPEHWTRDPFGGELVSGEGWGRGAVDMLNLTASQAVALKALARRGWRPRGTLVYLACADEEAGWMPYGAEHALVKAAQVVTRLANYRPAPYVSDLWTAFVGSLDLDPEVQAALVDPSRVDEAIAGLPPGMARLAWSSTHTTFSPNTCRGGVKTNVIPDVVDIEVDIRTIPGDNEDEVRRHLDKALGALAQEVAVEKLVSRPASVSPSRTRLWDVLGRVVDAHYPGARLLPRLIGGFTDAPYFRERGAVAYGFGLFSRALTAEAMTGRFHGNDERIDVESLALTTQAWLDVCEAFLG